VVIDSALDWVSVSTCDGLLVVNMMCLEYGRCKVSSGGCSQCKMSDTLPSAAARLRHCGCWQIRGAVGRVVERKNGAISVFGYQHDHVVSEFQRTCAQLDRPKVNVLRLWPTTTSGKLVCSGDLILTFSLTSEISHPSPVQGMWVSNFNRTSTPTTFPFASRNALMGHEWTVTGSGGYSLPTSLSMQSEPTIHHMPLSTLENTPPAKRMFCNQPRKARYKRARGRVESETQ